MFHVIATCKVMRSTRHLDRSESSPNFICLGIYKVRVRFTTLSYAYTPIEMTYKEKFSFSGKTLKVNNLQKFKKYTKCLKKIDNY